MATTEYVYRITQVLRIVDADTYWLRCDVGFRQEILINVRLHGYDCPEKNSGSPYEKQKAAEATEYAYMFLSMALPLYVRTMKDPDNFGRWLGDIWADAGRPEEETNLGNNLQHKELATVWPTRWWQVHDPQRDRPAE